jgi:hypothetical protein
MLVRILHESGKVLVLRCSQATVLDELGNPLACSYEQQGSIIHCDATEADWPAVCNELGLVAKPVEVVKS